MENSVGHGHRPAVTDRLSRPVFFSPTFYYTFGPHPPGIRISSGTSVRVICPDSDNELSDGTLLVPERRHQDAGTALFAGNPMAGPIFVAEAEPGDTLAVRIDAVHLDRVKGQTALAPAHGLLPAHLLLDPAVHGDKVSVPRHLYRWQIDAQAGVARLENPLGSQAIAVPLDPFVGCIGVCPEFGQAVSTLYTGAHGGNMDVPLTRPETTLYLPVFRRGGLLMMGDIHAAQGIGEIIGGAIETSGAIDCTISVLKGGPALPAPRVCSAAQLAAIGIDGELRTAVQKAYAHLVDWLTQEYALNRWDAYNLISQTGGITLGGLTLSPCCVAAHIPLSVLPT